MSNQQSQQTVTIPLPKGKKNTVQAGCVCLMMSISMYGLVFFTLTSPILERVNAMGYVSLFSIFAGLGVSIMTPIGGKLGDIIGRRNIVVIPGIICAIAGIAFAFARSLPVLMILRLLVGLAQGAFTSAPYIIAGLIHEKKDVAKAMGLLATAVALGSFGGSIIAGFLTDMGMLEVAILIPAIPLLLGVVLVGINMPNQKREGNVSIDVPGIIALSIALCGILMALNFGSSMGWTHPAILAGFVIGIAALVALMKIEEKAEEPLIPLRLLKNRGYTVLLAVGFIAYFYQTAMNVYSPISTLQVLKVSGTVTGSLQMPRTLITIVLPTIAGAWVGKKASNSWKAMAFSTGLAMIPMLMMGFTTPSTSIILYFVAIAITGIAESFRSVAITPAAQSMLQPSDIGVGTSLVNFFNSLASTVSAAVFGVVYNNCTASDPSNAALIQKGVNQVFITAAIVSFVGVLIVIFIVRPQMSQKEEG